MKRTQFIVQEENKKKRENFYDYITKKYDFKILYPHLEGSLFVDTVSPVRRGR